MIHRHAAAAASSSRDVEAGNQPSPLNPATSAAATYPYPPSVTSTTIPSPNDPYGLSSGYKTEHDLDSLVRPNTSRKRLPLSSSARRAIRLESFYRSQNAAIERMLKPVDQHRAAVDDALDRIEFCSDDALRMAMVSAAGLTAEASAAQ